VHAKRLKKIFGNGHLCLISLTNRKCFGVLLDSLVDNNGLKIKVKNCTIKLLKT
jgi:hypothetical protein